MDAGPPPKRKGEFSAMAARKVPKLTDAGPKGKMTFAQRMMAKMGHIEGQGLGKSGEGIINPIEVKLRPQGAGVGAVKEKTEQYKQEQRRAAEARGEEYEDSSEEERKARKKRKEKSRAVASSGTAGATGMAARRKTKYKTVEEVQAAAPGLELPRAMLGSIVDATGSETKLLTSTAGLMSGGMVRAETEEDKIKKRERIELEAFIEAWHGLQERKLHLEAHEGQLQLELSQMEDDIAKVRDVLTSLEALSLQQDMQLAANSAATDWKSAIQRLDGLQERHRFEIESCGLADVAVSILMEPFRLITEDWDPLDEPELMVSDLMSIAPLLGIGKGDQLTTNGDIDPDLRRYRKRKTTTPFETLMYRIWLPKITSAVDSWSCQNPQPMVELVETWRPLLPAFIFSNVMEQMIVPKLNEGLRSWHPRKMRHSKSAAKEDLPHIWIFPWLPLLPAHHLDPNSSTNLMSEVRGALKQTLVKWDLTAGPLPGLTQWSSLMPSEISKLLMRYLLPRLATHLAHNLEIDPSDQKLDALDTVFAWKSFFTPKIYARILVAEYFPKLLAALYDWLTFPDVDVTETLPWLEWWKSVIPPDLTASPDVQAGFASAQRMISQAEAILLQGGDLTSLTAPAAGPARPIDKDRVVRDNGRTETGAVKRVHEATYKDVVELWCAENDLTLMPLREAHAATGMPLLRISASATGKGGVVVYIQGDNIWAQKKGEKGVFEKADLDERLVARAEGR